jgi:hypothetical protein
MKLTKKAVELSRANSMKANVDNNLTTEPFKNAPIKDHVKNNVTYLLYRIPKVSGIKYVSADTLADIPGAWDSAKEQTRECMLYFNKGKLEIAK